MSNTTKNLQYQLSNGMWANCESRSEEFLNKMNSYINNHCNKKVLLGSFKTAKEMLDSGKKVSHGSDWYENIRYESITTKIDIELVKCDCGHTVPKICVMNASIGTSCADCYDNEY